MFPDAERRRYIRDMLFDRWPFWGAEVTAVGEDGEEKRYAALSLHTIDYHPGGDITMTLTDPPGNRTWTQTFPPPPGGWGCDKGALKNYVYSQVDWLSGWRETTPAA